MREKKCSCFVPKYLGVPVVTKYLIKTVFLCPELSLNFCVFLTLASQLNCYWRINWLLGAFDKTKIIKTNYLFSRKSLQYWRYFSFLVRLRGWLFSYYDHRMRKVVQGVFVVLHSGDEYEHSTKLKYMTVHIKALS